MTKRWLPMPRITFDDTGICFGEPPSVLATIFFLIIPDDDVYVYVFKNKEEEERWRKSLGLASWWVYIRWPCLLACVRVYYTVAGIFENRTGFLSLARAIVYDNVVSRPLPLFNPKEKRKKKGTKLCDQQLGGEYTHTHWGVGGWGNESTTWALNGHHLNFVLLFGRSVGRSGKTKS